MIPEIPDGFGVFHHFTVYDEDILDENSHMIMP